MQRDDREDSLFDAIFLSILFVITIGLGFAHIVSKGREARANKIPTVGTRSIGIIPKGEH